MRRNKLKRIEVSEISLVKRGAVPTARIALAKSEGEPVAKVICNSCGSRMAKDGTCPECGKVKRHPIPRRFHKSTVAKAMEDYAKEEAREGEHPEQAFARLCEAGDPLMQKFFEAYEAAAPDSGVRKVAPLSSTLDVPEAVIEEAKALRRSFPNLSISQAITRVLADHPHLYDWPLQQVAP